MSRFASIAGAILVCIGTTACAAAPAAPSGTAQAVRPTLTTPSTRPSTRPIPVATLRPSVAPSPSPAQCPPVAGAPSDATQVLLATANIFGAGHEFAPMPGGGGRGSLPPVWTLPGTGDRIVTISCAVGMVNPVRDENAWNGPEGDGRGPTDVESFEGIAGIVDFNNGMFVVGVFLTDDVPTDPAPERLDFSSGEDFDLLEPSIAQTFFVGDGKSRRFRVPPGATRLFLGFADGFRYVGKPGWYNNNVGQLEVTVEVAAGS